MTRKELFEFVKEKVSKTKEIDTNLGGLTLKINDHLIKELVFNGEVFEKEKVAYFYGVNYTNVQLGIYTVGKITFFQYDELLGFYENGAADFFIKPKMK